MVLASDSNGDLQDDASASLASATNSPFIFNNDLNEVSLWLKIIDPEETESILGYSFTVNGAYQVRVRIGEKAGEWQDISDGITITVDDINELSNDIEIIFRRQGSNDVAVSDFTVQICEEVTTRQSTVISTAPPATTEATTTSIPSTQQAATTPSISTAQPALTQVSTQAPPATTQPILSTAPPKITTPGISTAQPAVTQISTQAPPATTQLIRSTAPPKVTSEVITSLEQPTTVPSGLTTQSATTFPPEVITVTGKTKKSRISYVFHM